MQCLGVIGRKENVWVNVMGQPTMYNREFGRRLVNDQITCSYSQLRIADPRTPLTAHVIATAALKQTSHRLMFCSSEITTWKTQRQDDALSQTMILPSQPLQTGSSQSLGLAYTSCAQQFGDRSTAERYPCSPVLPLPSEVDK